MISKTIDCGKVSGIYLMSLGALTLIAMIIKGILFERLELDFFFLLFFLAGYYLLKHNNTARKAVLAISFIGAIMTLILAMITPFIGPENMKINLLLYRPQEPSLAMAYLVLFLVLIVALIPIGLLYNDKAQQEFNVAPKAK